MSTLSTHRNSLVTNRIGGGKSQAYYSYDAHTCASRVDDGCCVISDYCSRKSSRRLFLCLLVCALALVCTSCHRGATVCGVPYSGATPWQLAAAIHDSGDQTFVPVCVDLITSNKAYISGYRLPDDQPAQIICDIQDGKVTAAILYTEND